MKGAPQVYLQLIDDLTDLLVVLVKSAVKANISMEASQFHLQQLLSSEVNYPKDSEEQFLLCRFRVEH